MTLGKGKILFDNDFTSIYDSYTVLTGGNDLGGGVSMIGVNEGSIASTVDETGGIIAITTDTADNDNHALVAGKFSPSDAALTVEARWKVSNVDVAVFFGFTETLALDTPVMPAEFATTTMTYNGTGGMVGIQYDVDGTTDDYRAVMGDGGANTATKASLNGITVSSSLTAGIRFNADVTADQWIEGKIELWPDGSADVWFSSAAVVNAKSEPILQHVRYANAGVTPGDLFFATLMAENRSGNARVLEVDYFRGWAGRDWRYN